MKQRQKLTLKLGSLVKETLVKIIREQEGLTNGQKSETKPAGLGFVCSRGGGARGGGRRGAGGGASSPVSVVVAAVVVVVVVLATRGGALGVG